MGVITLSLQKKIVDLSLTHQQVLQGWMVETSNHLVWGSNDGSFRTGDTLEQHVHCGVESR